MINDESYICKFTFLREHEQWAYDRQNVDSLRVFFDLITTFSIFPMRLLIRELANCENKNIEQKYIPDEVGRLIIYSRNITK